MSDGTIAVASYWALNLHCDARAPLLFTENETNNQRLFGTPMHQPYVKDGINDFVVSGQTGRGQSKPDGHQGRRTLSCHH